MLGASYLELELQFIVANMRALNTGIHSRGAGVCTIEGNIGTIAATGTTPHTATTGCSHLSAKRESQAL